MNKLLTFYKTSNGRIFLSIFFGIALSAIFRKVCKNRDCIIYKLPKKFKNAVFKFDGKCYRYEPQATTCKKNIIQEES